MPAALLRRGSTCGLKKLTLMVFNSRARLLVLVLLPVLMSYHEAWPLFEPPRIGMAEPWILAPEVGATFIATLRLLTLPPPLSYGQRQG